MIHYLKGILKYKSPAFIIVEVGGVGYEINIPLSSFDLLPPEGKEIKINTYLHWRENGLTLYGFVTQEERDFFGLLISISKIGPKSALRIVSRISPSEFKRAIKKGDLATLTHVPGIGGKTAQRLILELKERVEEEEIVEPGKETITKDTLSALISLGYTRKEAEKAVKEALRSTEEGVDLAGLIREALRHI
ncbi:Holliday junction branch migration protein RuvA [Candidatus Aerophobetes bacterium Ae_b3b]|nr:MAG: Holliday junction branch migration protein RuvA [Candidatus Aerophobetes bacterium Ae_b3b]